MVQAAAFNKEQILRLLRECKDYLGKEFGVSSLGLFGSFARDQAGEDSDIDLVVDFERPIGLRYMELADYLEALLGRKVDLLTPAGVQSISRSAVAEDIQASMIYV